MKLEENKKDKKKIKGKGEENKKGKVKNCKLGHKLEHGPHFPSPREIR